MSPERKEWGILTVDLLEGELFGLPHEAEDHAPGDKVETGVESDCAGQRCTPTRRQDSQAPGGVITVCIRGKVRLRTPAVEDQCIPSRRAVDQPKKLLIKTTKAIPCSRWMVGNTSEEYWKATGPSPSE